MPKEWKALDVCSLLYVNIQRDSSSLQQVFNKCTLRQKDFQDFQNFLGQHPIVPVQEWVTHFGTFPHMSALIATKMCAIYFVISSCYFISIEEPVGCFNLIPVLKISNKI